MTDQSGTGVGQEGGGIERCSEPGCRSSADVVVTEIGTKLCLEHGRAWSPDEKVTIQEWVEA